MPLSMEQLMQHAAGPHSISTQTLEQGLSQAAERMGITWSVVDSRTQATVRRNIKTLRAAHNIADRLDNEYGAVRYTVKREA